MYTSIRGKEKGISFHHCFCAFSSNLFLQSSRSRLPSRKHVYMVRTVVFDGFLLKKMGCQVPSSKNEEQIQAFHREKKEDVIHLLCMVDLNPAASHVSLIERHVWMNMNQMYISCIYLVCVPLFVQLGKVNKQSNIYYTVYIYTHCNAVSPSPSRKIIVYT